MLYFHNSPHHYSEKLIINNSELLDIKNRIFLDTFIKMYLYDFRGVKWRKKDVSGKQLSYH